MPRLSLIGALLALILICLSAAASVRAQSIPTVAITLSQSTAQQGDTVTALVSIRDAVNIGGADVGIGVDNHCLRITDRQTGSFLPATDGSFTPFTALHDYDTRLALAITDRSKLASGSGTFYQVALQVTCAQGTAPVQVTFAELSAYKDPTVTPVQLEGYTLSAGNLHVVNAQLQIGAPQQASPQPTTGAATAVPTSVTTQPTNAGGSFDPALLIVPLLCLGVLLIFAILWLTRWLFRGGRR